ncbi:energy transducer TonB [Verrucomicrobiaceae bacterium N1E253]|uniref:Energy transducer TonB n=1 Tax=Oceaniferula marina TaxID=2748318 RepID=A0A851GI00_9BACT|nr:energy transducer TonB [Oceaniferula marina]NWK54845.1 energy transducer TonB [Oceaniferula marina]
MRLASIFLGIAITVVLLAALVLTRMMVLVSPEVEYEIREVDTVTLPEPPPPPAEEPVTDDAPPPPPPALADLTALPDVQLPAVPVSQVKIDPTTAVDAFFTDQPPSPLPQPTAPRKQVKGPKKSARPSPQVNVRPKVKSQYSLGELDQKPRLLRNPSVTFPRSIRNASSGRVVVRVTILPSGKSQFLSVVSSTHPDLIPAARRIANGSRFTNPTRQGKAVKAVMTWPITIKK